MATRRRPVFHARFGAYMRKLRIAAGLGRQNDAARRAQRLKLATISQPRISLLEKGQTKDPEPDFLHELAVLYQTNYDTILTELVAAKYGARHASDLSDHAGTVQASSGTFTPGGVDVPTAARIRELEDRLIAYEAILERSHELATELLTVTTDRAQSGTPVRVDARRRRRDRKTD